MPSQRIAVHPHFSTSGEDGVGGTDTSMRQRPVSSRSFIEYTRDHINERLHRVKKVQFFTVLFISTVVLIVQTAQCVDKYFAKDTGTGDKYVHVSSTSFPVMTICPTYPYRLPVLRSYGVDTLTDLQFGAQWVPQNATVSPVEFYEDVVLDVEEIVKEVLIHAEVAIDGTNNIVIGPKDTLCGERLFFTREYYFNGDCFALTLPQCLRDSGVLEIVLDFFNKTDIFIHHPGQFLSPNSRSRVDVDLGRFVKIAVNHEVVQLLDDDGSCVADTGDYTDFDDCMYSTLRDLSVDELGCTVPWLPDKSRICVEPSARTRAFDIYQKNRRNQNDICPDSCLFTNMYFGPPVTGVQNEELRNFARAVFYFRRSIKLTSEYYLYSGLSMVAEIGAYVGLLLGVSLLNLADINNFCIDFCMERNLAKDEEERMRRGDNKVFAVKRGNLDVPVFTRSYHM